MASHPPRLNRFNYIGKHHYFLTFCTHLRMRHFTDAEAVDMFATQLEQSSARYDIAVDAYCVMPDHVHLLVKGLTDAADLQAFVAHLKQHSGFTHQRIKGTRLWQGSYYDHVLRAEEGTAGVIAYIVDNPVRACLVERPEDYAFWGSFTQTREGLLEFMRGAGEWKPPVLSALKG